MLKQLYIKNFTLIETLDIAFREGFSVITGETGAGKSIILGAMGLLLGQRADSKSIKSGADKCVIEAHFDLSNYDMEAFFEQNEIEYEANDCIVRRELTASGKSRAFINDTPVSLSLLKELGDQLMDIHSQHQNLLLAKQDFQLGVVDIMADDAKELNAFQQLFARYQDAARRLQTMRKDIEDNRQRADFLRFQYEELSNARLFDGEQEELEQRSETMTHSEDIKTALYEADNALSGDVAGIVSQLKQAASALHGIERVFPKVGELSQRLDSSYIEVKDISQEVGTLLEGIDFDPAELDAVNARLDKIYDLEKKYHAQTIEELLSQQEQLHQTLNNIENSDEALADLEQEVEKLRTDSTAAADKLSACRKKAAARIEKEMQQRLVPLGMPHVRFAIELEPTELSKSGSDKALFLFSANTSTPMQPVAQVASGGEIARVMLALKALISGAVKLPTIIFDEIDTGVSGKIAGQMAQIMAEMGSHGRQVISITHLPQIAAQGTTHYKVYKEETPTGTASHMQQLTQEERVTEIAQMLSGNDVSEAAIQNAKELLSSQAGKGGNPIKTIAFLAFLVSSFSLLTSSLPLHAQSWTKKASKAVVTLKTFNADGTLLGSSTGFFVGEQGEAVSSYAPFRGAEKGIVFDADGKEYPVECMLGANETYDVAKFRVAGIKKSAALKVAQTPLPVGSMAWLLPCREQKNAVQGVVRKAETFNTDNAYYTVAVRMPEGAEGCPLLNEQGEVVGLMQASARQGDTINYAVSARFAEGLRITGLSINDPALRATRIKTDLPAELDQAVLTLYVASSASDSLGYVQLVNDFIARFPSAPDGYESLALLHYNANDFAAAQRDYEQAIKVSEKKDETHYAYSRLIYQKEIYKADVPFAEWSLDKALQEARTAYELNPQPSYRHQQAVVLFAQKQYAEARDVYAELSTSTLRSPQLFYEASRCCEQLADTVGQLAQLDSALALFSRPLLKEAAPFLLARAQVRLDAGRYRDAVADLNDYENLMKTQVNDHFYYIRHQADVGGRLYQQALNDIDRAIALKPDYDLYHAEKASLQIRVGLYDDAMATARECIRLAPEYSDGYLFLGLAQCLKGQKEEGLGNLQRAKELGDPQAEDLIKKYQ